MAYIPLARKYRPEKFSDLTGQEATVRALTNAIELGREPRSLVFSGVRGVGKTTTARLYAKALTCVEAPTPNPCNQCSNCQAVRKGVHEDVLEVDGASNTGVDDVRALQETLSYAPQRSKVRVFIIDEVHMLSQSAFNALLKTLEEPPDHVIFIFATTELNKIPSTILSRCQIFHLERMAVETIETRLQEILEVEGVAYEKSALRMVAAHGQGSMRDALTFLDQVIALGGGKVALSQIRGLTNKFDADTILDFVSALIVGEHNEVVAQIDVWDQSGLDFTAIAEEVAKFIRHCFILKHLNASALGLSLLGLSTTDIQRLEAISQKAHPGSLHSLFKRIVGCRRDLSGGHLDRFILENSIMEWFFTAVTHDVALSSKPAMPALLKGDVQPCKPADSSEPPSGAKGGLLAGYKDAIKKKTEIQDKGEVVAEEPKLISKTWPSTWVEMIAHWKSVRPMQARILEEVFANKYSPEEVELGVDPTTGVAFKLLNEDVQKKVLREMRNLFDFNGLLRVIPLQRSSDTAGRESVFQERKRVEREESASLSSELKGHQVTLDAITVFNGTVDSVELNRN